MPYILNIFYKPIHIREHIPKNIIHKRYEQIKFYNGKGSNSQLQLFKYTNSSLAVAAAVSGKIITQETVPTPKKLK